MGQVWERYADLARWSEWAPQLRKVEPTTRLRSGLTGRVYSYPPWGLPFEVLDVTEGPEQCRWSWRVGCWRVGWGRMSIELEHVVAAQPANGVEPGGAAGTVARLRLAGPGALIFPYAPVARLALHRLVH